MTDTDKDVIVRALDPARFSIRQYEAEAAVYCTKLEHAIEQILMRPFRSASQEIVDDLNRAGFEFEGLDESVLERLSVRYAHTGGRVASFGTGLHLSVDLVVSAAVVEGEGPSSVPPATQSPQPKTWGSDLAQALASNGAIAQRELQTAVERRLIGELHVRLHRIAARLRVLGFSPVEMQSEPEAVEFLDEGARLLLAFSSVAGVWLPRATGTSSDG